MQVSEKEIGAVKQFILQLNSTEKSAVVVEGKKDAKALKKLGFSGKIVVFHKFGSLTDFTDSVAQYENVIMLLDGDRKGRYLTGRIIEKIQRRTRVDLSYKKKLISITKGKVRFIEQLSCYESFFERKIR